MANDTRIDVRADTEIDGKLMSDISLLPVRTHDAQRSREFVLIRRDDRLRVVLVMVIVEDERVVFSVVLLYCE